MQGSRRSGAFLDLRGAVHYVVLLLACFALASPAVAGHCDNGSDDDDDGLIDLADPDCSSAADGSEWHLAVGDVLIADPELRQPSSTGALLRLDPTTGFLTFIAGGASIGSPFDVTRAPDGTIFFSDSLLSSQRFALDPDTGAVSSVNALFGPPLPLAVDDTGLIWTFGTPSFGTIHLRKVDPVSGATTVVSTGGYLDAPRDILVEPGGNLLVSDRDGIVRIDATTGSQTLISDFDTAGLRSLGMSFDGSGDLVVIERNNDEVYSVPLPAGGAPTAVTSAGAWGAPGVSPTDVAVESDGSLLVCQRGVSGPDAEIWRVPGGTGTPVMLSLSPSMQDGSPQSLFVVQRACGDGLIQAELGETCDDGNAAPGDGCNVRCVLEACGDGKLDVGEECDDGNTASWDTCSATCAFEDVYFMNGTADGGAGVSVTLDGVIVAVAPSAGQTAAQVLAALAAAINADGALDALGTKATTRGEALYTNGSFTARTNTDTGLAWGARSDLQLENSELEFSMHGPKPIPLTVAISQGVAPPFLVWEDGSFTLPSDVFVGTLATATATTTVSGSPFISAFEVSNDAIACSPASGLTESQEMEDLGAGVPWVEAIIHGPPGVRCAGPLNGFLRRTAGAPGGISFPLNVVGGSPPASSGFTTTILGSLISVGIAGVPWTGGTASVLYGQLSATATTTTTMGSDARRIDGVGQLNAVTPIAIRTYNAYPVLVTGGDIPGFATLRLHFVPEPGAFAMLGAGSALLALMSWRRSSRRGRRR